MKRPIFSLVAVCTIDGKIARHSKHLSDWSSKEDKDFLHKILDKSDAVVVGNNTYQVAQKPLSKRNCIVFTRSVKNPVQKSEKLALFNPAHSAIESFCRENGYKDVCVLGGAKTFNYFLHENLADEIYLTIEPIAFGSGITLFDSGEKYVFFDLVSFKRLNKKGTVLLHYRNGSGKW